MYASSSIDSHSCEQITTHPQGEPRRFKLKGLLRRLGGRSADPESAGDLQCDRVGYSTDSFLSTPMTEAEKVEDEDTAWDRPPSRVSRRSRRRQDRSGRSASDQQGCAEMLDDENSAWVRPPRRPRRRHDRPSSGN